MFTRHVQREHWRGDLRGHARDEHDALGVGGGVGARGEEMGERHLRQAHGMREVDVEEGVAGSFFGVAGFRAPRGVPEIAPVWLRDAGAGTDDGDVAEGGGGVLEHGCQGGPGGDVGAVEESTSRGGGRTCGVGLGVVVLGEEVGGFGAQGQVGEEDIAVV